MGQQVASARRGPVARGVVGTGRLASGISAAQRWVGRQGQAFLSCGGRYVRPRCLKMSSSAARCTNVSCNGNGTLVAPLTKAGGGERQEGSRGPACGLRPRSRPPALPCPARRQRTCSGSYSPSLFSHSPLSFRLKWRSSRSKCWGESNSVGRAPTPDQAAPRRRPYLGAGPAKQGEGELADGGDHQVHAHCLPGAAGPQGALGSSPRGTGQAENAEASLQGVGGAAAPGWVGGLLAVPGPVLVVQDQALRRVPCDRHVTTPGAAKAEPSPLPSPAPRGCASLGTAAPPPGPPGGA